MLPQHLLAGVRSNHRPSLLDDGPSDGSTSRWLHCAGIQDDAQVGLFKGVPDGDIVQLFQCELRAVFWKVFVVKGKPSFTAASISGNVPEWHVDVHGECLHRSRH